MYDFNKNIKTAWCLNLKHIISKRKRERDTERDRETERETYELCFIEFVSPCVKLNPISYFFERWCHLTDLNHISNALFKQIKKIWCLSFDSFYFYFY